MQPKVREIIESCRCSVVGAVNAVRMAALDDLNKGRISPIEHRAIVLACSDSDILTGRLVQIVESIQ